jgi:hypothetical protein
MIAVRNFKANILSVEFGQAGILPEKRDASSALARHFLYSIPVVEWIIVKLASNARYPSGFST